MKKVLTCLALMLGIFLAQGRAYADMPEPKSRENPNITAGRKAIEAKDYKTAIGYLTKAIQEVPKDADAHTMLAYSYRKTNVFDKSMEHYQTALKLDSKHRSANEYLGELYLDMNQLDNAEKQLVALKSACPFFGKCEEYEDLKKEIDAYKAKKK